MESNGTVSKSTTEAALQSEEAEDPQTPALRVGELFDLSPRLVFGSTRDEVELQAKYSISHLNYFAVVLKQ